MTEEPKSAIKLFYSYAHEDERMRKKLEKHLASLQQQGLIASWHDRMIGAGTAWEQQIDEHINRAHIILLLISASFLASPYCTGIEMKRAMERHEANETRVIPVILRPVHWQDVPFAKLQVLPTDGKPIASSSWRNQDEAFANVVTDIRKVIEDLMAGHEDRGESVTGLPPSSLQAPPSHSPTWNVPYSRNPYFTGREAVLTHLHTTLASGTNAALTQPQAISGLDGIGKTQAAMEQDLLDLDPILQKHEQLKKLASFIAEIDVSEADLEMLYYSSIPDDPLALGTWQYPKGIMHKTSPLQLLRKLTDAPVPEKGIRVPPILNFVERLARYTRDPLAKQLRKWVEIDATQAWNVSTEDIAALRERLEEEDRQSAVLESPRQYVLITLETVNKSESKPTSFTVKAWLRYGKEEKDCEPLHWSEDIYFTNVPLEHDFSLFKLIDKLLNDIGAFNRRLRIVGAKLVVEFFLPDELLCSDLAIESWELDDDKIPLGCQHAVVIRSLERIKPQALKYRAFWEDKWKRACNLTNSTGEKSVYYISQLTECDGNKIYSKLRRDDYVVCLCLMLAPSLIANRREMFRKMLKAGTPIALWPRNLPDEQERVQEFQKRFSRFILNQKPLDLPVSMLKQRLEAMEKTEEYHLGSYLTLFWDDPNRLPPDDKLEETAIRM
ncbi:MAG: hypothetical protein AUI36_25100 [Cyanobacteria bacterium 13_1_40CM_2_61_4]|nr:MAG: hypothetical protein AUI36_25100 [Cyanobacteria bacterium 13_1_40CM_2_61_4]